MVVAAAILAVAAVTVLSRQSAGTRGSSSPEGSSSLAGKANKGAVALKGVAQEGQEDGLQKGKAPELTPEEQQRMAEGLKGLINKSTEDRAEVQHPDGSVSMDIEGRFQSVTVARVEEDGTVTQSCVDNPRAAGAFFGINPEQIKRAERAETPDSPNRTPVQPQN